MIGFEISINGKRVLLAGLNNDPGVLNAIIDYIKRENLSNGKSSIEEEISIRVGGLNSNTKDHLEWTNEKLKIGDSIIIKVVEALKVDDPALVRKNDSVADEIIESKIKYFYQLKEELKDYL